jgi:uncharacterized iron-regulated protein
MHKFFSLIIILGFNFCNAASADIILDLNSNQKIKLNELVDKVSLGDVLVLGESHATVGSVNIDQKNQALLIEALVAKYKNVSVGMEFIDYPNQKNIDLFLNQKISESDFLNQIQWGQSPFADYKKQVLLPLDGSGWTFGLNAPKELTSFVGKNGIEKLTPELLKYMPPDFKVGNAIYKNRFMDQMSFMTNHGMNIDYYFEAQSIWDDTMAWNATEILKQNSNQILVIIVGQFHVMYGGGLPSRLKDRGISNVISVVQSGAYKDLSAAEEKELINDKIYGPIADYFW